GHFLYRPFAKLRRHHSMITRFNPIDGLVTVPVKLWGPSGQASILVALDTGATRTLVSWDLIAFLGYDPASAPVRLRITTAKALSLLPRSRSRRSKPWVRRSRTSPLSATLCPQAPASTDSLASTFCEASG